MVVLETVLSDRYVCQISCFSPQVKYLGEFLMLAMVVFAIYSFINSQVEIDIFQT